ncbi:hypothetical protein QN277_020785 [Acacia crassicarpa]|uniref:Uncharacterized protein n=1 Tax=Acacia crassicarpa TaxID=499986 RepID=A0AAE1MLD2_9FABA|nr:hypothetical protein QN277_020785 [Acacia crassicarpa]
MARAIREIRSEPHNYTKVRIQSYRRRRKDPDARVEVSADINMNIKSQKKDGVDSEEEEGVDEDGLAVGLHASELQLLAVSREGAEQAWLKKHEQHHADEHWGPIRHFLLNSHQDLADPSIFFFSPISSFGCLNDSTSACTFHSRKPDAASLS